MTWTLIRNANARVPFVQWVDRDRAAGWARRCGELARAELPPVGQPRVDRTLALAEALGELARALDLSAFVLEPYARRVLEADPGPMESRLPGVRYPVGRWDIEAQAAMRRVNSRLAQRVREGKPYRLHIMWRCGLRFDGSVMDDLVTADLPPDPYGTDAVYRDCPAGGDGGAWSCSRWREWWPGALQPGDTGECVFLPPLEWHYELFRSAAEQCGAMGWQTVLARSREWVAVKNIITARAIGVQLDGEIAEVAAEWATTTLEGDFATRLFSGGGAAIGAAIAAANPIVGALVGVIAGIPALLMEAFGRAAQGFTDVFGRREPVLEVPRLTGSLDPQEAPSHQVADPPPPEPVPLFVPLTFDVTDPGGRRAPLWVPLTFDVTSIARRPKKKGGGKAALGLGLLYLLTRGA